MFVCASVSSFLHFLFRIHLMAGRVPVDSDRATVAKEMEAVFVQNLKYAADILSKVSDLLCPTYHCSHVSAVHKSFINAFPFGYEKRI